MLTATVLPPDRRLDVIDVLADAFHDYPVMRWIVGPDGDVPARIRRLIDLFVSRRVVRGGPMFGIFDGRRLVGAAVMTLPVEPESPAVLAALADEAWRDLGDPARIRYVTYVDVTAPFFAAVGRHHHLNMIGIRPSHAGQGLARPLLEAVHQLADADAESVGVSLTTERLRNVQLYEHLGYRIVAHQPVGDGLETWGLVRDTSPRPPRCSPNRFGPDLTVGTREGDPDQVRERRGNIRR